MIRFVELFGISFSLPETVIIAVSGIVPDFDLILGFIRRCGHHRLFTHTPMWMVVIWMIIIGLCGMAGVELSLMAIIMILFSLILHLVLDDLGCYWFHRLGLQSDNCGPRIIWLYPIQKMPNDESGDLKITSLANYCIESLPMYFKKYPANRWAEIIIILTAVIVFLISNNLC
ncbi:MAG: hypothetical protein V1905_02835 [bacterium]